MDGEEDDFMSGARSGKNCCCALFPTNRVQWRQKVPVLTRTGSQLRFTKRERRVQMIDGSAPRTSVRKRPVPCPWCFPGGSVSIALACQCESVWVVSSRLCPTSSDSQIRIKPRFCLNKVQCCVAADDGGGTPVQDEHPASDGRHSEVRPRLLPCLQSSPIYMQLLPDAVATSDHLV